MYFKSYYSDDGAWAVWKVGEDALTFVTSNEVEGVEWLKNIPIEEFGSWRSPDNGDTWNIITEGEFFLDMI